MRRSAVIALLAFNFFAKPLYADAPAATPRMVTQPNETPKQLWENRCRMCHGGFSMLKTLGVAQPEEIQPLALAAKNPALFKETVKNGRQRMPAFYALTEAQLSGLVAYLVSISTPSSTRPPL